MREAGMPASAPGAWFAGLVWQSGAIVALHALDALTTIWGVSSGAVELNAVAAALLAAGPLLFLVVKLVFAAWVVIGLAWVARIGAVRMARMGAYTSVLLLSAVVAWNGTMLALVA